MTDTYDPPATDRTTPALSLRGLRKTFGSTHAVDGIDLDVRAGEFFSMLGPSGSGKTTVLRMVAGFEAPTDGTVLLDGVDVTHAPPFRRDVNTVFQEYALFPHMSVIENVEYGLRVKKVSKTERRRRATEALETVRLADFGDRRPNQMSGGQRQRVALARALVNRPQVLLLDEPLGALDLKLRRRMQVELKQMQRDAGITFLFVTHDQEEALSMSDRIAVFNNGQIEQVATPSELYEQPATSFVAGFVGTSNVIEPDASETLMGVRAAHSVRPEKIEIRDPEHAVTDDETVRARGKVREVIYLGASTNSIVDLDAGGNLTVQQQNLHGIADRAATTRGEPVVLTWPRSAVVTLHDHETSGATDGRPSASVAPDDDGQKESA